MSRLGFPVIATVVVVAATIGGVMALGGDDPAQPAVETAATPIDLQGPRAEPGAAGPEAGSVRLVRVARPDFEPYIADSTTAQRTFIRDHYFRLRGYPPTSDQALEWGPPAHFYDDLYALDPTIARSANLIEEHPDWVLRDAEGAPLYIPFACNGGTCPSYAADPGNPEWRRQWIEQAEQELATGYVGIFVDNVNLDMHLGDGSGAPVAPIDPRTGAAMTDADWHRYVTDFVVQVRRELPEAEIVHNAVWYAANARDPRQVLAADYVEIEHGFSDSGVAGGDGSEYAAMLEYVDWVHSLDRSVMLEPYDLDDSSRLYELASYFLINAGGDAVASEYESSPDDWWPGWQTQLGAPIGPRVREKGVYRRDFERGIVLVNPPAAPARAVSPPGAYVDLEGAPVESVTLGPAQGAILVEAG